MTRTTMLYRLNMSEVFSWAIADSDLRHLEIYKNLYPPLPTIIFTVNSHADSHFYKYIYLFQALYIMKSVFS